MAQQKSEKVNQQELRQPDAFQEVGWEVQDWIIKHQKMILTTLGVLAVGGLGAGLVSWWSERSDRQAAKELGAALAVLDRPVVTAETPVPPTTDPSKPPFKSQKEQDEALVKSLTDFRKANGGSSSATTAALALGKAQYRLGDHANALASFDEFLKKAGQKEPLRVAALEGKGYTQEAQGKFAEAAQTFEQMGKEEAGGYLAGMGTYHQARMLILQGKKEEGARLLSEISEKHPNTAAARQATERLALLATQGVKPPPKAEPTPPPTPPQGAPTAPQETK